MKKQAIAGRALILLLAGAGASAACASAPSGPPPFNPAGTYSYEASVEGFAVTGTMTIEGTEGSYAGSITNEMMPPVSITSVAVMEQTVTVLAAGPEGGLTIEFVVTGDAIEGSWAMAGLGGSFTGTKIN